MKVIYAITQRVAAKEPRARIMEQSNITLESTQPLGIVRWRQVPWITTKRQVSHHQHLFMPDGIHEENLLFVSYPPCLML